MRCSVLAVEVRYRITAAALQESYLFSHYYGCAFDEKDEVIRAGHA